MLSLEIARALLSTETQQNLSLPAAVLIMGLFCAFKDERTERSWWLFHCGTGIGLVELIQLHHGGCSAFVRSTPS
jgi:hypothetical protein